MNNDSSWKNSPAVYSNNRSLSDKTPLVIDRAINCKFLSASAARCISKVKDPGLRSLSEKQFEKLSLRNCCSVLKLLSVFSKKKHAH